MESDLFEQPSCVESDEPCLRYSPQQLAEIAGVTPRRIRAWVKAGLIQPIKDDGLAETFHFLDVRIAVLLAKLSNAGLGTPRLKQILNQLRRRYPDAQLVLSQLDVFAGLVAMRDDDSRLTAPNGQLLMDLAEEAEGESTVALKMNPTDADAVFERAATLEQEGNFAGAAQAYRAFLSEFGPEPVACFNLANVLSELGKNEAAAERYRQAVELDPEYASAWNNLGIALSGLGEIEDAFLAWRQAVRIEPHLTDAIFNLADALQQAKRGAEAREMWRAYLAQDADSEWADYARACLESSVA
jgi:tetratricopeptide (TPR) repeat protein